MSQSSSVLGNEVPTPPGIPLYCSKPSSTEYLSNFFCIFATYLSFYFLKNFVVYFSAEELHSFSRRFGLYSSDVNVFCTA